MASADWLTELSNLRNNFDVCEGFNPTKDLPHPINFTVATASDSYASSGSWLTGSDVEYYPNPDLHDGHYQIMGPEGEISGFFPSLEVEEQSGSQNLDIANNMEVEHAFAPTIELSQPDQNVTLDYTSQDFSEPRQSQPSSAFIVELSTQISIPTCPFSSCNGRTFRDKACLKRHKSEVHGSQAFTCSIGTCKRSKRGFHRRYNLYEHQKRVHKLRGLSNDCFGRARPANKLDDVSEGEATSDNAELEDRSARESSNMRRTYDSGNGKEFRVELQRLRELMEEIEREFKMKLQKLRELLAGIEEDIRSPEMTERIMEE